MRYFMLALLALLPQSSANAHFHMLLVDRSSVKTGEKVSITYKFGHPYEAELLDAEKPAKAQVFSPDGTPIDVLPSLTRVTVGEKDKKPISGYTCAIEPKERGDYTVLFESPAIWMEEEQYFVQDTVRVNIHVQADKGWRFRHPDTANFVFIPLTRPYGLRPGTVFQARLAYSVQIIELEKYNVEAPKELPPEEFRTHSFSTDDRGVATCTLPEKGWWILSSKQAPVAMSLPEAKEREGKKYRLYRRATLCVYVDGEPAKKPEQ